MLRGPLHMLPEGRRFHCHRDPGTAVARLLRLFLEAGPSPAGTVAGRRVTYAHLRHALRRGLLRSSGGPGPAVYSVTLYGRCMLACAGLGTGMAGLCILAEARATHASQAECGCPPSYDTRWLCELLGDACPPRSAAGAARGLCRAGLAVRTGPGSIRLSAGAGPALLRHAGALDELHRWLVGMRRREAVMSVGGAGAA